MQRATCSSFCDITFCCNVSLNEEIWQLRQQVFCHFILSSIYCSIKKCFELPCSLLMHISNSKIKSLVSFILQIFGCTCAYYGYSVSYFNDFSFTHSMPSLIYIWRSYCARMNPVREFLINHTHWDYPAILLP